MKYQLYNFVFAATILLGSILFSHTAFAARVFVTAGAPLLSSKDLFYVDIKVDTEGTSINAIDAEFTFPENIVDIESTSDSQSIVTGWVDRPTISGNAVLFSGIISGGFNGLTDPLTEKVSPGTLLRVYLMPKKEGREIIQMTRGILYKNDGLGTSLTASFLPFLLELSKDGSVVSEKVVDRIPPEEFTPLLVTNPDLYDGAYSVLFDTKDKGSGIAYYEVKEGKEDWIRAESPYRLTDQSLTSVVLVRVTDQAGNTTVETLRGPKQFPLSILLLPLVLVIVLLYILRRWYRRYTHGK